MILFSHLKANTGIEYIRRSLMILEEVTKSVSRHWLLCENICVFAKGFLLGVQNHDVVVFFHVLSITSHGFLQLDEIHIFNLCLSSQLRSCLDAHHGIRFNFLVNHKFVDKVFDSIHLKSISPI